MTRRLPLPINETSLEYALAHAMALPDDLANLPQTIEARLAYPDESELPFLIWEWGLQPVLPYLKDPRRALAEGRPWQKRRGTIPAGDIARGWIGVDADHEQTKERNFHLHLSRLISGETLDGAIVLSRLSHSLRNELFRLTYQFDIRPTARGRNLRSGSLRSTFSGVKPSPDYPLLSFREYDVARGSNFHQIWTADKISVTMSASRSFPVVRGRHKKPNRLKLANPFEISLSVELGEISANTAIDHTDDRILPVAALYRGASRRGALQSVRPTYRETPGERPRRADFKRAEKLQVPTMVRVTKIPTPNKAELIKVTSFAGSFSEAIPVNLQVPRHIKRAGFIRRPQVFSIEASESLVATNTHFARLTERLEPIAGVRRAHSKRTGLQTVRAPRKRIYGEGWLRTSSKRTQARQLPGWAPLYLIPTPIAVGLTGEVGTGGDIGVGIGVSMAVTGLIEGASAYDQLDCTTMARFADASWSHLPAGTGPMGDAPRGMIFTETE